MRKSILTLAVLLLALAAGASHPAYAANTAGQVTHLSGVLTVKRADGSTKLLSAKSEVQEGDTLSTEQDTYARIKFVDGAEVVLRPDTQLKVASYFFNEAKPASDSILLNLLQGGLRAVTGLIGKRNRDAVSFSTSTATVGIRGTHHGMQLCQAGSCAKLVTASGKPLPDGLHIDVAIGAVVVKNKAGEQVIPAGKFGYVRDANTAPVIVPPKDGFQVAMPSSISHNRPPGRHVGIGIVKDNECSLP